jgi:anti-sigma factor RsiW
MTIPDPTPELLLAHALGELSLEESAAVRRWLVVQTDERVLEAYRALESEAARRRIRLAHWAERPLRARIERALWRARARAAAHLAVLVEVGDVGRSPALSPLGARVRSSSHQAVVGLPAGASIDVSLQASAPGHVAAFALVSGARLEVLREDKGVVAGGERVELRGFVLEGTDDVLEIYVVSSASTPIPMPAPTDGPAWLAELLERIAERGEMTFLHRVFVPSSP